MSLYKIFWVRSVLSFLQNILIWLEFCLQHLLFTLSFIESKSYLDLFWFYSVLSLPILIGNQFERWRTFVCWKSDNEDVNEQIRTKNTPHQKGAIAKHFWMTPKFSSWYYTSIRQTFRKFVNFTRYYFRMKRSNIQNFE